MYLDMRHARHTITPESSRVDDRARGNIQHPAVHVPHDARTTYPNEYEYIEPIITRACFILF